MLKAPTYIFFADIRQCKLSQQTYHTFFAKQRQCHVQRTQSTFSQYRQLVWTSNIYFSSEQQEQGWFNLPPVK